MPSCVRCLFSCLPMFQSLPTGICFKTVWDNTTFIQDIFDVIYCAEVVVVDFTGRNPNVMYETGIAHTLGKNVIPITQSIDDIPSDLGHHRALKYLPNEQGYKRPK